MGLRDFRDRVRYESQTNTRLIRSFALPESRNAILGGTLEYAPPHRPGTGSSFSPFVAEFPLGNVSIDALTIGLVRSPMYGVVIIREVVCCAGKGWPTMFFSPLLTPRSRRAWHVRRSLTPSSRRQGAELIHYSRNGCSGIDDYINCAG